VPSEQALHECDTVLILGSTMPWVDFHPRPGQARGVQIDINSERIGLRYPVEVGLVGDVQATLQALLPMLQHKQDRSFHLLPAIAANQRRLPRLRSPWIAGVSERATEEGASSPQEPQTLQR
jgi:thiamine pyrophosphate-dependent acetolactate synthase large subunit-like protein